MPDAQYIEHPPRKRCQGALCLERLLKEHPRRTLMEAFVSQGDIPGLDSQAEPVDAQLDLHNLESPLCSAPCEVVSMSSSLDHGTSVRRLGYFAPTFPALLKQIPDPPLLLYAQGNIERLNEPVVAMVGARRATTYGRNRAAAFAAALSDLGVTVVSGLALGIDGAAHRGVLGSANSGNTIAVLGSGLDQIYPRAHLSLANRIIDAGGLLLSEYPPGTPPRAFRFPERNRLISGLAIATVVVEAGERSGSLITARLAAEQGRDVLAMPGPVENPVSQGCHRLIQQGAALITNVEDVLEAAGIEAQLLATRVKTTPSVSARMLSDNEQAIMNCLQGYPVGIDELSVLTGMSIAPLAQLLVVLEIEGFVTQGPLGYIPSS